MPKAQYADPGPSPSEPAAAESRRSVRSVRQLRDAGLLSDRRDEGLDAVARQFSVAITPRMLDQIEPANPGDPVGLQFLPDGRELHTTVQDETDPIGDKKYAPLPGIIHRYPDRALLMPISICPVYCRFCFRRETIGKPLQGMLSQEALTAALDYLSSHSEIWEVILSGGDPLLLSPLRLQKILTALRKIDHIRVIRIHTRVPLVMPERITTDLAKILRQASPLFVVLHSNHSNEFTGCGQCSLWSSD